MADELDLLSNKSEIESKGVRYKITNTNCTSKVTSILHDVVSVRNNPYNLF